MDTKICPCCQEEKITKENFHKNKNKKDGYHVYCKICRKIKKKEFLNRNKKRVNLKQKEYRNKNKEIISLKNKDYYLKNKETITKRQVKYNRERRHRDKNYNLICNLRARISYALKRKLKKADTTMKLLGCSSSFLISYLESKFKPGMSWDNYGIKGWHVDHIKACSCFDLSREEEQYKCFNWTNLQPLWWYENLHKHAN